MDGARGAGGAATAGRRAPRRGRAALAVAVGIGLGLGVAEIALRARFPALPSVAALADADLAVATNPVRDGGCHAEVAWKEPPPAVLVPGDGAAARVWVVGDSVGVPVGVEPEASWWFVALRDLADGRRVEVRRLATPGADYCGLVDEVRGGLDLEAPPDALVVSVFADDLERHQRLSVGGRDVLLPSAAPDGLRPLVTRSYLANLAWWALEPSRRSVRARGLSVGTPERYRAAMRRMVELLPAGTRVVFVLQPPSGLASCPTDAPPGDPCAYLPADLAVMGAVLRGEGWPVVDLEPLFRATPLPPLATDLGLVDQGRLRIPIHVAPEGQARIGEEVARQARALGWSPLAP